MVASTVMSWLIVTSPDEGGTTPPPQQAVLLQLLFVPEVAYVLETVNAIVAVAGEQGEAVTV